MEGGDSQFIKVIGLYMLCINHYAINLIVMENALVPNSNPLMKFDIKGSRFNRQALKHPDATPTTSLSKLTLKDLDFYALYKSLKLSPQDAEKLMRRLTEDVAVLARLGLMDYSLLIAVYYEHDEQDFESAYFYRKNSNEGLSYRLALIDITQLYNFSKRTENCLKHVLYRIPYSELSSVNPEYYATRFLEACKAILA
jgi:1-phosphatidylinositol-4-phosphate 5-kinase